MPNVTLLNYLKSQKKPIFRHDLAKVIYEPEDGPYAPWTKQDIDRAERQLRQDISDWNKAGEGILSTDDGICYSTDPDEIDRIASRYYSMGTETLKKANALKETAQAIRDKLQMTLTEGSK